MMEGDQNSFGCLTTPKTRKVQHRRGRPKATMIKSLMLEGASSPSGIRCEVCSRVFPRSKSLQAHRRVHTGERPYSCDYPGCIRKFKQSSQLKTHQRLHTGERPFLCSAEGCSNRFTHANRHCQKHPNASLTRCDDFKPQDPSSPHHTQEVREWLFRYMKELRWSLELKEKKKECGSVGKDGREEAGGKGGSPSGSEGGAIPGEERGMKLTELSDMTNLRDGPLHQGDSHYPLRFLGGNRSRLGSPRRRRSFSSMKLLLRHSKNRFRLRQLRNHSYILRSAIGRAIRWRKRPQRRGNPSRKEVGTFITFVIRANGPVTIVVDSSKVGNISIPAVVEDNGTCA